MLPEMLERRLNNEMDRNHKLMEALANQEETINALHGKIDKTKAFLRDCLSDWGADMEVQLAYPKLETEAKKLLEELG